MKYITLPSGHIINLNQVAYIYSPGIFGDQEPDSGTIHVVFSTNCAAKLEKGDKRVFLDALEAEGVKTGELLAATKKIN